MPEVPVQAEVPIRAIEVAELPGRLVVFVDDRPDSVVIWYRAGLAPGELADILAHVWELNARRRYWQRASSEALQPAA